MKEAAQLSNSSAMDVQGIKKKIQELPKSAKFSKQWAAEQILLLVEKDEPPATFLELILDNSTASVDHRTTRYIELCFVVYHTVTETNHLLELTLDESHLEAIPSRISEYTLIMADCIVNTEPFLCLEENLQKLQNAGYDTDSEITSRPAAEYIMVPAIARARKLTNTVRSAKRVSLSAPATPRRSDGDSPKSRISRYMVTGRADWAAGYDGRSESETVLLCVEAKQGKQFGTARTQLLTYLAICRHARRVSNKAVPGLQGFTTDGGHYEFQYLTSDGTLYTSFTYDTRDDKQLKLVYNFIIQQAPPQAVMDFEKESFWGIFEPPPVDDDDDEPADNLSMAIIDFMQLKASRKVD
ncbi:hypothetical protein V8E54_008105 [Elaphomyces granulatus]